MKTYFFIANKMQSAHLSVSALACLGMSILFLLIPITARADIADEVKVLIEQGKPKEAYDLGMQHPELFGDVRFDYAFGVAAVDSGRASLGVLALERVLLQNPADDLVRLELARGYFTLGEYQRARDEFLEVKRHNPPAAVVNTINIYLDAIIEAENKYRISGSVYAEVGGGYNSNVNNASVINNIILPIYGPVQLSDSSKPKGSAFSFMSAGGNIEVPLSTGVSSFTSVGTSTQKYAAIDGYDLNITNGLTGIKLTDNVNTLRFAGFASVARQDQVPVPSSYGGGAQYERALSAAQIASVSVSSAKLDYGSQYGSIYNATLNTAGLGYRRTFSDAAWSPVLMAGANYSHQNNTENRPDLGRKITGATLGVYALPSNNWGVSLIGGYSRSNYDAQDIIFLQTRKDNLWSLNGTFEYKMSKTLSTRLELTYYNNVSNLGLYSFTQATAALKLRYQWDANK